MTLKSAKSEQNERSKSVLRVTFLARESTLAKKKAQNPAKMIATGVK